MGKENSGAGITLYMMDGGKAIELPRLIDLPEISDSKTNNKTEQPEMLGEITIKLRMMKHSRCRNRKRFIKLMMGEGLDRNTAERFAEYLGKITCYQWAWTCYQISGVRIKRGKEGGQA